MLDDVGKLQHKYAAYTWEGEKIGGVAEVGKDQESRELLQQDNLGRLGGRRLRLSAILPGSPDAGLTSA